MNYKDIFMAVDYTNLITSLHSNTSDLQPSRKVQILIDAKLFYIDTFESLESIMGTN